MGSERRRELESALREAESDLVAVRAELTETAAAAQALNARTRELEAELSRRPELPAFDPEHVDETVLALDTQLRDVVERERRLATRVAELETPAGTGG